MYDNLTTDINLIEHYKSELETEKKGFEYGTYSTFNNSYLNNCSDEYIRLITSKLNELYSDIEKSYEKILEWLNEYVNNSKSLENFLSSNNSYNSITDSTLRNFVASKFENYDEL